MKTIFLLLDSLNRKALSCYGSGIKTPNIDRLRAKSILFQNHYSGSMPCMPARRDLQTGRYNFFHSSWGPLEPYDNSLPDILQKEAGVYTHLITDHMHYFEDGGSGYHTTFNTWEFHRGQEYDPWIGKVNPDIEKYSSQYDKRHYNLEEGSRSHHKLQHLINKEYAIKEVQDYSLVKCFDSAISFLNRNKSDDNWFLQLECFDPHEPFDVPDEYLERYGIDNQIVLNWPDYAKVTESPEEIENIRKRYAALVAFIDDQIGRLLDNLDKNELWKDTAVILSTDHGYLLSEHDWWAKTLMPAYQEISHIPLMIYHPDYEENEGETRSYTTTTIDIMPTILDFFQVSLPQEIQGLSLLPTLKKDCNEERIVASGIFGGSCLITDGEYAYHYFPKHLDSTDLYEYRIHPCHMRTQFTIDELSDVELYDGFDFTKGIKLLQIKARDDSKRVPNHDAQGFQDNGTRLFHLSVDPLENNPIHNPDVEKRLMDGLYDIMKKHDAPESMFRRFGL